LKKRWIAGLVIIVGGAVGYYQAIEGDPVPESHGDLANIGVIANTGGQARHTLGEAYRVDKTMLENWSDIEKGIKTPAGTDVRLSVLSFNVTEAQADSVNAKCKCLKVNDSENPTALISF